MGQDTTTFIWYSQEPMQGNRAITWQTAYTALAQRYSGFTSDIMARMERDAAAGRGEPSFGAGYTIYWPEVARTEPTETPAPRTMNLHGWREGQTLVVTTLDADTFAGNAPTDATEPVRWATESGWEFGCGIITHTDTKDGFTWPPLYWVYIVNVARAWLIEDGCEPTVLDADSLDDALCDYYQQDTVVA